MQPHLGERAGGCTDQKVWPQRDEHEVLTWLCPPHLPQCSTLEDSRDHAYSSYLDQNAGLDSGSPQDSERRSELPLLYPHLCWNPVSSAPAVHCSGTNVASVQELESAQPACLGPAPCQASADSTAGHKTSTHVDIMALRASHEQKLAVNRQAQKRFRQRRKDRAHNVELQLVATTAELRKLKEEQQRLETRNVLLEKLSSINKQEGENGSSGLDVLSLTGRRKVCNETSLTDGGRGVTISLRGHEQHITVEEISKFSLHMFAALWTEYIRELGMLLVQLNDEEEGCSAQARMELLTTESTQLLGCFKALNPSVYKAVCEGRLDGCHPAPAEQLDLSWFTSLPRILSFTDAQMQDFSYLRRLYLTKRALFALERQKLLVQMHASSSCLPDPSDGLGGVSDLAAKLRRNAHEDYEVYIKIGYAVRRGVCTTKQWAVFIMHAYPFFPGVEQCLESIVAGRGETSMQEIIAGAQSQPMTAEWKALDSYLCNIKPHTHDYEQIPRIPQHWMHSVFGSSAVVMNFRDTHVVL